MLPTLPLYKFNEKLLKQQIADYNMSVKDSAKSKSEFVKTKSLIVLTKSDLISDASAIVFNQRLMLPSVFQIKNDIGVR